MHLREIAAVMAAFVVVGAMYAFCVKYYPMNIEDEAPGGHI